MNETMKQVCESAIKTKEKISDCLLLDKMLLEAEEKLGMMDGLKMEDWLL